MSFPVQAMMMLSLPQLLLLLPPPHPSRIAAPAIVAAPDSTAYATSLPWRVVSFILRPEGLVIWAWSP